MSNIPDPHARKSSLLSKARSFSLVFALGMLAGVLIWAKLRLVTDIPRSAYADPREVEDQTQPSPSDQVVDQVMDQTDEPTEDESEDAAQEDSKPLDEDDLEGP